MAKSAIIQYDTTAANNSDVGGVGILGTNLPRNLDDGMRTLMAHMAAGLVPRRAAKGANYNVVQADFGQVIEFTAARTLTTDAAATLLDGWYCYVYAAGGAVNINPNSSETVNGAAVITLPQGEFGCLRVNNGNFVFNHMPSFSMIPTRLAKSSGYTAAREDFGRFIDFTSAATLATAAAATLLDGWFCFVYASGGDVTIDPNSTETVNGATTIIVKSGWSGILRVNNGNFIFQYLSLRDDTPKVAFLATSSKSIASNTATTLDDLDAISDGTLGNSTLSNGVFTVGTGDAGWYEAKLQYKPVDTGGDYVRVATFVTPSAGLSGNSSARMASGNPVWVQSLFTGELAEGATLTFTAFQTNGAAAARSADTGTHISVRRVGGIPA